MTRVALRRNLETMLQRGQDSPLLRFSLGSECLKEGDVVAANLLALKYPTSGTFNIGTGRETEILTIYLKLQEIARSPLGPVHGPAKPGEQRRSALDSALALEKLGWQPTVTLEDGLARTFLAFSESERG